MYCPNCAAQNETDMKFCRACGQDLALISQAMTKSAPMMVVNQVGKELELYKELRQKPSFTRGAYFTVIGLFLFVFMSLLILVSGRISFSLAMLTMLALYFMGKGVRDLADPELAEAVGLDADRLGDALDHAVCRHRPVAMHEVVEVAGGEARLLDRKSVV